MPETQCRGCGAVAHRTSTTFDAKGKLAKEICPQCAPENFGGAHSITDRKVWMGHEDGSLGYKKRETPEGRTVYESTDEQRADDEAHWQKPADDQDTKAEKILAARRQFGSRSPLTPHQIEMRKLEAETLLARMRG